MIAGAAETHCALHLLPLSEERAACPSCGGAGWHVTPALVPGGRDARAVCPACAGVGHRRYCPDCRRVEEGSAMRRVLYVAHSRDAGLGQRYHMSENRIGIVQGPALCGAEPPGGAWEHIAVRTPAHGELCPDCERGRAAIGAPVPRPAGR